LISEICNCLNLTSFSKERTNHCEHVTWIRSGKHQIIFGHVDIIWFINKTGHDL
jgi:hypothetical protein